MSERDHSPKPDGPLMSGAQRLQDDDRIPPGYSLFQRDVRLPSGATESIYYSTRDGQVPDPDALERSGPSIIEGFVWALTVDAFADDMTEADDRALEIGNMMGFALTRGLTEEQVVECYEQAFAIAKETQND